MCICVPPRSIILPEDVCITLCQPPPLSLAARLLKEGHGRRLLLLAIAATIFVVLLLVLPADAAAQAFVFEELPDWAVICAACVGFALGAGIFALPEFLAFLLTPLGQEALVLCAGACIRGMS